MREKRTRIPSGVTFVPNRTFKPVLKDKSAIEYNSAKLLLRQGYSTQEIFSKFNLLKGERLQLIKEESILNFKDPMRQVNVKDRPAKTSVIMVQAMNTFKKMADPIHNEIIGLFRSNQNLRRYALPDVE